MSSWPQSPSSCSSVLSVSVVAMTPHLHPACLPSLAPPLLPHSQSGTSAHSTICPEASQLSLTRKLFRETPALPALQLHCFSYMAIHRVCVFHDGGPCFHNWIRAAPMQCPSPVPAGPLGGDRGGPSMFPSPSALTSSSLSFPPIHPHLGSIKNTQKKRPGFSLFSFSLRPAMFCLLVCAWFFLISTTWIIFGMQILSLLAGGHTDGVFAACSFLLSHHSIYPHSSAVTFLVTSVTSTLSSVGIESVLCYLGSSHSRHSQSIT